MSAFASGSRDVDKEILLLVRRLAGRGLVEYHLGRPRSGEDLVVIEPQVPDYWPRMPQLGDADALVLSRFAYMRRRGNEMVLESPRAGALFKICNPKIATADASNCFQLSRVTLLVGLISDPYLRELARRNWHSNYGRRRAVSNDFMNLVRPLDFIVQGPTIRHAEAAG